MIPQQILTRKIREKIRDKSTDNAKPHSIYPSQTKLKLKFKYNGTILIYFNANVRPKQVM